MIYGLDTLRIGFFSWGWANVIFIWRHVNFDLCHPVRYTLTIVYTLFFQIRMGKRNKITTIGYICEPEDSLTALGQSHFINNIQTWKKNVWGLLRVCVGTLGFLGTWSVCTGAWGLLGCMCRCVGVAWRYVNVNVRGGCWGVCKVGGVAGGMYGCMEFARNMCGNVRVAEGYVRVYGGCVGACRFGLRWWQRVYINLQISICQMLLKTKSSINFAKSCSIALCLSKTFLNLIRMTILSGNAYL